MLEFGFDFQIGDSVRASFHEPAKNTFQTVCRRVAAVQMGRRTVSSGSEEESQEGGDGEDEKSQRESGSGRRKVKRTGKDKKRTKRSDDMNGAEQRDAEARDRGKKAREEGKRRTAGGDTPGAGRVGGATSSKKSKAAEEAMAEEVDRRVREALQRERRSQGGSKGKKRKREESVSESSEEEEEDEDEDEDEEEEEGQRKHFKSHVSRGKSPARRGRQRAPSKNPERSALLRCVCPKCSVPHCVMLGDLTQAWD